MRNMTVLLSLALLAGATAHAAELRNLLANPDFEDGASGWTPTGAGFVVDTDRPHSGSSCIRLDKPEGVNWVGAMQEVALEQQAATPVVAWAWCRSRQVVDLTPSSFCIYLDIEFQQDTRPGRVDLPGQTVMFAGGSTDWHYRELIISPQFPIKSIKYYLLFRGTPTGTAWLDDVGLAALSYGPLAGVAEDLPPLPDGMLEPAAQSLLDEGPADAWQVMRAGAGLQMPRQVRSLPAQPGAGPSATAVQPQWRGEVPVPALPTEDMALYFLRRWERRSLLVDHSGQGQGVLWVLLPAGERVQQVELKQWDVHQDAIALYRYRGRVLANIAFAGDATPARVLVRLGDEPPPGPRPAPAQLTYLEAAGSLRLGFGEQGELWQVTAHGAECADRSAPPGGLQVGALDEGVMHPVGGAVAVAPDQVRMSSSLPTAGLQVEAQFRVAEDCVLVSGEVRDTRGADRAVDVLFTLPVEAQGWRWHDDILSATDLTADTGVVTSDYPLAAITRQDGATGLGLALDPKLPVDFRLGFDPARHRFYLRVKLGLSPDHKLRGRAPFSFLIAAVDPAWGMRDLLAHWYRHYSEAFVRRANTEGMWLFAIEPPKVPNPQDYGYYEGNPAHARFNAQYGIVTCPYIIPGQRTMRPLERMPADYEEAMAVFEAFDPATAPEGPVLKDLIINCRVMTVDGRYPIRIRDDFGADIKPAKPVPMVVFSTNPDPELPAPNVGQYTLAQVKTMIQNEPLIGGIYVDSCAAWVARYRNVRRDHFATADFPLVYDDDTGALAIDGRFSMVEFLRALGEQLHPEGRVVFPNLSTGRGHCWTYFAADVCGLEGRRHDPASLAFFRTMAGTKPALRLDYLAVNDQPTPLSTRAGLEEYFRNCATWGVYPSIGRRCAEVYQEHRDLFEAYLPALKALGAAGWQPVPHARIEGAPKVIVERFGPTQGQVYLTVLNLGEQQSGALTVDWQALGATGVGSARELLTGARVDLDQPLSLGAGKLMVLQLDLLGM